MLTRDDVIRLARKAGWAVPQNSNAHNEWFLETAERFTNLVIADFLERSGQYVTNDASREAVIADAVAATRKTCEVACAQAIEYAKGAEREACAKLCDQFAELMRSGKAGDQLTDRLLDLQAKTGDDLAAIILARRDKGAP